MLLTRLAHPIRLAGLRLFLPTNFTVTDEKASRNIEAFSK
jgi:hypothetical protein